MLSRQSFFGYLKRLSRGYIWARRGETALDSDQTRGYSIFRQSVERLALQLRLFSQLPILAKTIQQATYGSFQSFPLDSHGKIKSRYGKLPLITPQSGFRAARGLRGGSKMRVGEPPPKRSGPCMLLADSKLTKALVGWRIIIPWSMVASPRQLFE